MIKGFYTSPNLERVSTQPNLKQIMHTSKSQVFTELSNSENLTKVSNRISKDFNPYSLPNYRFTGVPVLSPKKAFSKAATPINSPYYISKGTHSRATKSLTKNPIEDLLLKSELSPKSNVNGITRETASREKFVNPPRTSYTRFEDDSFPRMDSAFNPSLNYLSNSRVVIRKQNSRSPPHEVAQAIFTDNMKKYRLVTVPGINLKSQKSTASLASPKAVIKDIKNLINIHLKSPPQKKKRIVKLQAMGDINMTVSNKLDMTKEEEQRILIVKKKIHISNTFEKYTDPEHKKMRLKEFFIEFHPDKRKYDKPVCDEITNFLVLNRPVFLGTD